MTGKFPRRGLLPGGLASTSVRQSSAPLRSEPAMPPIPPADDSYPVDLVACPRCRRAVGFVECPACATKFVCMETVPPHINILARHVPAAYTTAFTVPIAAPPAIATIHAGTLKRTQQRAKSAATKEDDEWLRTRECSWAIHRALATLRPPKDSMGCGGPIVSGDPLVCGEILSPDGAHDGSHRSARRAGQRSRWCRGEALRTPCRLARLRPSSSGT